MNDYAKKMIQKDPMMYVNANGVRPLPREMMGNEFEQSGRYGRVITRTPATSFDMGMPGVGGTYDSELFRKMMEEKMRGQQSEMDQMMRSRGQEAIQQQRDAFAEQAARQAEEAMREGSERMSGAAMGAIRGIAGSMQPEGGPGKDGVEMHSGGGHMRRGSGMGMGMPRMERREGGPGVDISGLSAYETADDQPTMADFAEEKKGFSAKDLQGLLASAGKGLEGIAKGVAAARGEEVPSDRGSSNLPDMDMGEGEGSLGQKFMAQYLASIMG